jgi:glycine betaine/proline transport system substrate-binding protein
MNKILLYISILFCLCCFSCEKPQKIREVRIGYTDYNFDQSVVMILKGILDTQDKVNVELFKLPDSTMFNALARGDLDAVVSGWLPNTHRKYIESRPYEIIKHSTICDSLGIYLVVPYYSSVFSIEELRENGHLVNNTILIPEKQNAVYEFAKDFLKDYDFKGWNLRESNWDGILTFVDAATKNEEEFAFIGFRPHWIFDRYNIRALEDYRNSFGGFEQAYICVNNEFTDKSPTVASFLSNVTFTLKDIENVMELNQTLGSEPYENAHRWINSNTSRINRWLTTAR